MTAKTTPAAGWFPVDHADVDNLGDVELVAWVRLYALADAVWPASAPLPRWVSDATLGDLGARLWIDHAGDRYRIPRLDEARKARSDSASKAALARWAAAGQADLGLDDAAGNAARNAPSNAENDAEIMPTQNQNQNQNQTVSIRARGNLERLGDVLARSPLAARAAE